MSVQFYCCVFSYIDLKWNYHRSSEITRACSSVRCSRTGRLYRSTHCSWWTLLVLIDRLFQRSITLQLVLLLCHLVNDFLLMPQRDVPVTYGLNTLLFFRHSERPNGCSLCLRLIVSLQCKRTCRLYRHRHTCSSTTWQSVTRTVALIQRPLPMNSYDSNASI